MEEYPRGSRVFGSNLAILAFLVQKDNTAVQCVAHANDVGGHFHMLRREYAAIDGAAAAATTAAAAA